MKSLVTSALIVAIAALFAVGSSPLVFAANETTSGAASVSSSSSSSPLALVLVPVSLSFSPTTVTLHTGSPCPASTYCAINKLSIHNAGAKSITFTGCQFFSKKSTSSTYVKGTCSLSTPVTVAAGATKILMWGTLAPFGTAKGTYNAKVDFTNSVDKSGTGKYNFIVP
jgi:hypothetical protein